MSLTGFTCLNSGADSTDFATANGICVKDCDECPILLAIPALVEDSEPRKIPGHMTLVKDVVARRDKRYADSTSYLLSNDNQQLLYRARTSGEG
jgi:hypothetical protein